MSSKLKVKKPIVSQAVLERGTYTNWMAYITREYLKIKAKQDENN